MKQTKTQFAGLFCLLFALLFAFQGCIRMEDGDTPSVHEKYLYPDVEYRYTTDITPVLGDILTQMSAEYLILANKTHPVGPDYQPETVVELTCRTNNGKTVKLEARAAKALYAMMTEMEADGIKGFSVTSGYRSYAYQKQLFDLYLEREQNGISEEAKICLGEAYLKKEYTDKGKTKLSYEDAKKTVLSYSAYPGTSEHQTGLCVDFIADGGTLDRSFENTEAFRWLYENAHRFGYILRYREEKESVTGYSYEPWHFRFVGREAATEMAYRSLTLEEFLESGLNPANRK